MNDDYGDDNAVVDMNADEDKFTQNTITSFLSLSHTHSLSLEKTDCFVIIIVVQCAHKIIYHQQDTKYNKHTQLWRTNETNLSQCMMRVSVCVEQSSQIFFLKTKF